MSWWQKLKDTLTGNSNSDEPSAPAKPIESDQIIAELTAKIEAAPEGKEKIIAYLQRGNAHKQQDSYALAIADFEQVIAELPGLGVAHAEIGFCELSRGNYERAIKSLDRAIALLPNDVPKALAHLNRSEATASLRDFETALAHADKAQAVAPQIAEHAQGQRERIATLRKEAAGKPQKSKLRKPSLEDLINTGWILDRQDRPVDALVAFGQALEIRPDPDALYGRGVVNCKLNRHAQAIADLDAAIAQKPRFPAALTERGLAYVNGGNIDRGIADFDATIAIDPGYALAYGNKGTALLQQERWKEALPYLDMALRMKIEDHTTIYNRSAAHEMLEDFPRAVHDLEMALAANLPTSLRHHAEQRSKNLRTRAKNAPPWQPSAMDDVWKEYVLVSLDETVGTFVKRVGEENSFFAVLMRTEGEFEIISLYGEDGLRRRLTEIADVIGPAILSMRLKQFDKLLQSTDLAKCPGDPERKRIFPGPHYILLTEGAKILGVYADGVKYHYPHGPTAIFGPNPVFERTTDSRLTRKCTTCGISNAYYKGEFDDEDMLIGYACSSCNTSPVLDWIENRMRPGAWSISGFLTRDESLRDVIAVDGRKLAQLGIRAERIADMLDKLLEPAFAAYEKRISVATEQFEDNLRKAGKRGVEGLAMLPIEPSFEVLEEALRSGKSLPLDKGVSVNGYHVFLQVYLGYQICPWTMLRRPFWDVPPRLEITRRQVDNVVHLNLRPDLHLPCRDQLDYRYGNVEFFVVKSNNRDVLRGSGLLVHLIRDHGFFEGPKSPFRLDPEKAATFLGLT